MEEKEAPEASTHSLRAAGKGWRAGLVYLLLYATLWLLLSGSGGWAFGAVAVCLAAGLSHFLGLRPGISRLALIPGFVGFYLWELVAAGWQVARSAYHIRMPIDPGWVSFRLNSRSTDVQLMLAAFVCLLPGTLASRVGDGEMHIHLLNKKQPWQPTVERLESRLRRLLGETG